MDGRVAWEGGRGELPSLRVRPPELIAALTRKLDRIRLGDQILPSVHRLIPLSCVGQNERDDQRRARKEGRTGDGMD